MLLIFISKRGLLFAAMILLATLGTACSAAVGDTKPGAAEGGAHDTSAHQKAPPVAVESTLDAEVAQARLRLAAMQRQIQDSSYVLVKRERVGGKLLDYEWMFTRVREKPFSVYMYFLAPAEKKGQQVVYIEGRNGGNLIAQPVGLAGRLGPLSLPPNGFLAMQGQRYPITEVGFVNLTRRLIEVGQMDRARGECSVKRVPNVKVSGTKGPPRVCTLTEVVHPQQRDYFRYYKARIFVDDQLNIPIRFESYSWPEKPGEAPPLLEEYTYQDVKLNNGFTDADFTILKK